MSYRLILIIQVLNYIRRVSGILWSETYGFLNKVRYSRYKSWRSLALIYRKGRESTTFRETATRRFGYDGCRIIEDHHLIKLSVKLKCNPLIRRGNCEGWQPLEEAFFLFFHSLFFFFFVRFYLLKPLPSYIVAHSSRPKWSCRRK